MSLDKVPRVIGRKTDTPLAPHTLPQSWCKLNTWKFFDSPSISDNLMPTFWDKKKKSRADDGLTRNSSFFRYCQNFWSLSD